MKSRHIQVKKYQLTGLFLIGEVRLFSVLRGVNVSLYLCIQHSAAKHCVFFTLLFFYDQGQSESSLMTNLQQRNSTRLPMIEKTSDYLP